MRATWVIAKREIAAFFVSPLAYVVLSAWLLWSGFMFYLLAGFHAAQPVGSGSTGESPLTHFFGGTTLFYMGVLVFVPLLTMRLLADETRSGTLETLLTAPVSDVAVVLGKFSAAMVFWVALWLPTLLYVWLTSRYGDVDLGMIAATYAGLFGMGLCYVSIGLAMSAVARSQIVAAVLTFVAVGGLFVLGLLQFVFTDDGQREIFEYVSVWGHMQSYARGVVDSRYVVFDLSLTSLSLLSAVLVVSWRRYEG